MSLPLTGSNESKSTNPPQRRRINPPQTRRTSPPQRKRTSEHLTLIRKEINFLQYPYFAVHTKGLRKKHRLEFRQVFEDNGRKLEACWTVIAHPDYGYPGPFDRRVNMAVEYIASQMPLPIANPIRLGSWYEFCRLMGVEPDQWHYNEIKKAIQRMIMTGIEAKHTFYHKGKQKWIEEMFHLYDHYTQKGDVLDDGSIADANYLYLNSWYIDNLNARYAKLLDYNYYKSLEPIASRLYEILGLKFYRVLKDPHVNFIQYRYSTLCQLLPVKRHTYKSDAFRQFASAHNELLQTKFLNKVKWDSIPHLKDDWYITYYPGEKCHDEMSQFADACPAPPEAAALPQADVAPDCRQEVSKDIATENRPDQDRRLTPSDSEAPDQNSVSVKETKSVRQAASLPANVSRSRSQAGKSKQEFQIPPRHKEGGQVHHKEGGQVHHKEGGQENNSKPVQEKMFPEPENDSPSANSPSKRSKKTKNPSKRTSPPPYSKEFLKFWEAYPIKVGKSYCWKIWNKISRHRPPTDTILSAIEAQKEHKKMLKTTGQFCPEWPHPSTWLNQGRWEDEVTRDYEIENLSAGEAGWSPAFIKITRQ